MIVIQSPRNEGRTFIVASYLRSNPDAVAIVRRDRVVEIMERRFPDLKGRFIGVTHAREHLAGRRVKVILEDADCFLRDHLGFSPDIITLSDSL